MSINCLNSIGKFLYAVGSFIASPFIALIQKIQSLFANKIGNNYPASISAPSMDGRAAVLSSIQNPQASANSDERVKLEGEKANLEKEVAKISSMVTGMTGTGKKGPAARKRKAILKNKAEVVLPARIAKINNKISNLS